MASISREPNGRRTLQFVGVDGKRRSIRLGKVSQKQADAFKFRVERLVAAAITGHAIDDDTSRWLASVEDSIAEKLAKVGLAPKRATALLAGFVDQYIAGRCDVKPSTLTSYGHTRRNLVEFFGERKPLREITPGDADRWRLSLLARGLAKATVQRRCGFAKQFFRAALRRGLIPQNPFIDLSGAVQANPSRLYFVTRKEAEKVIEACPDGQWRLLFALSRYGGLRCPSEHLSLTWDHVDWAGNRLVIPSPKTEHHPGGESRVIPIFPELRPYLELVWEQATPGDEYVITRYRDTGVNLRTQLLRIIQRAGLQPWPKLWQNLRSTRETELSEHFPLHVVCAWIGNTQRVAAKHYLQLTDEHFTKATRIATVSSVDATKRELNPVQNPVQQPSAESRDESHAVKKKAVGEGVLPEPTAECDVVQTHQVGNTGLEPVTSSLSCWRASQLRQLPGRGERRSLGERPACRTKKSTSRPQSLSNRLVAMGLRRVRPTSASKFKPAREVWSFPQSETHLPPRGPRQACLPRTRAAPRVGSPTAAPRRSSRWEARWSASRSATRGRYRLDRRWWNDLLGPRWESPA